MDTLAQAFGVFVAATIGASGLYIVANELHWCEYGRTTLFFFALYQFFFASTRALVLFDVWNRDEVAQLNIIGSAVFLSILINLIGVHWLWHRSDAGKRAKRLQLERMPR